MMSAFDGAVDTGSQIFSLDVEFRNMVLQSSESGPTMIMCEFINISVPDEEPRRRRARRTIRGLARKSRAAQLASLHQARPSLVSSSRSTCWDRTI